MNNEIYFFTPTVHRSTRVHHTRRAYLQLFFVWNGWRFQTFETKIKAETRAQKIDHWGLTF